MGYSIYIGNGILRSTEDEEWITPYTKMVNDKLQYFYLTVEKIEHENAPTFANDEVTGKSNCRHPSYSVWSDFCEETGLTKLFYDDLMRDHPGFQMLTTQHDQEIETALIQYKEKHPNAQPGFEKFSRGSDEEPEIGYDAILARLIWLNWWVKWVLKHCENAGIYNS